MKKQPPEYVYWVDSEDSSRIRHRRPIVRVSAGRWYMAYKRDRRIEWTRSYETVHDYIRAKDGAVFIDSKPSDEEYAWGPEWDEKWNHANEVSDTRRAVFDALPSCKDLKALKSALAIIKGDE